MDEFPDEVFLQMFRYVPILDLFRGFYNLNSRLNRIIGEVRIHIHSVLNEEEQGYILPNICPKQIRSFCVHEDRYEFLKLSQCNNIRQLEFGCHSRHTHETYVHRQLIHVQPAVFPHLRKLTIYQQYWSSKYQQLCTMIFSNQFPVLKDVYLPYANGSCVPRIRTWSTSLINVSIECCNKSMFYPLLNNLPNLKYFTCTFGTGNVGALEQQCLSLKTINLTTYDQDSLFDNRDLMTFEEMNNLYRCLPNLEHTYIFMRCYYAIDEIINRLHGVLSNCQKLKSFECQIRYSRSSSPQVSLNQIMNRYPLFRTADYATWEDSRNKMFRIQSRY
ncbi:unnamed protein product [Adineta steineri]|uniref:F-box domain-containing protein n=2 Tax=Adineta steineri TaxID=433720 RepID=A0A814QI26_9BILA|nr:unnamed protein product [Adineta steineri]